MLDPMILADAIDQIVEVGVEASPLEACGLICPDGTVFFLTNECDDESSYRISGAQLEAAFLQPDGVCSLGYGVEDVVLWHTHPSGYVGPSEADIESRRQLPEMMHMVVALPDGGAVYY